MFEMQTKMDFKPKITAKDCLHLANDIIVARNLLIPRLTSIQDINYAFLVLIFEDIFGIGCYELVTISPNNKTQEIKLMAKLLKFVSEDLLSISLDHIKAEDLVQRNLVSIHDFLEIISTFIQYIPKDLNKSDSFDPKIDSKCVQTNGLQKMSFNTDFKANDLFCTSDELKFKRHLRSESTSTPHRIHSSSSPSSSSESFLSIVPLRRRSLRQTNSCVDYVNSNRRQESKGIQTETQLTPKTVVSPKSGVSVKDISFDEYKRLKCENFANLLGHRLHETLRLKEMTDSIEQRIKRYYGDVTAKTPKTMVSKSTAKLRSSRKPSIRPKKSPQMRKPLSQSKQSTRSLTLDQLIQTFPEISKNTIKTLKESEKRQKKVVENLNKDLFINELKVKSRLSEAIETQQKRSQIIRKEIKHLEVLAETKASKMAKMKESAAKRDSRIERAKLQKVVDKCETDLKSKYKTLQSIEENIVLKEYQNRDKQQKDFINDFRKRIKEKHFSDLNKQKQMLASIETLYQNKYQMLTERLTEEERRLKSDLTSQSHYLRSIKRDFNQKLENDFKNIFKN